MQEKDVMNVNSFFESSERHCSISLFPHCIDFIYCIYIYITDHLSLREWWGCVHFYSVSYCILFQFKMVAGSGFDPPTSGLWAQHAATLIAI